MHCETLFCKGASLYICVFLYIKKMTFFFFFFCLSVKNKLFGKIAYLYLEGISVIHLFIQAKK